MPRPGYRAAAWPSGTPAGAHGENGLLDHSSRPATSPARTAEDIADLVEALRRQTKHGPARLAADLQRLHGVTVAPATVHRILVRRGLNRLRDLDPPTGELLREVIRYEHDRVGDLVHVDIKKLGRIWSSLRSGCVSGPDGTPVRVKASIWRRRNIHVSSPLEVSRGASQAIDVQNQTVRQRLIR
ncbi:helix-turn-helix domain-containing protein [Sphaerisporangium sp. NPDC051017]|uniref:helix-turn-helix domain-containing protein n=1 Tax=Sphaerisporangium sp. NPDC051017 TaxID=3154636 RepID=UPI00341EC896